eukprot:13565263-Alexandrium_andersonii.AAC.1
MTCGGPPSELSDLARHAQGAARSFWGSSRLHRLTRGRRATARTPRTSPGLAATMCEAVPQRRPSQMPNPQR